MGRDDATASGSDISSDSLFDLWAVERDDAWFEHLVAAELPTVRAYAARRVRDPDDVVSEVFATAWRHREDVPVPARAWLLRVASNHVLHAARSEQRRGALAQRAADLADTHTVADHAADTVDRLDANRLTSAAMAQLSAADRELLRLYVWEDLTVSELAEVLSCSTVAAEVRLHRARRRLATILRDLAPAGAAAPTPATPLPERKELQT